MKALRKYGIGSRQVHIYDEIDSTNLEAIRKARAKAPTEIEVFLARRQTAGRGRLGRSFVSEGGAGIYLSILIPKDKYKGDSLTAHTAVALAAALDELFGIRLGIKWVNDIYLSGKKLAGILVEAVTSPDGKIVGFVVGMGINVYKSAITSEISDIATSLEHNGIFVENIDAVSENIIEHFIRLVLDNNAPDRLISEYRARSVLDGKRIAVYPVGGEPYEALVIGINDDFTLKVRTPSGDIRILNSGEVKTGILSDS